APRFICTARPGGLRSTWGVNCWAIITVWSLLPPSTTISSSPGASATLPNVAGRCACSLSVGTITEMRQARGWTVQRLGLAIRRYIRRQQRHRIDTVQKTLERLTQRRQRPPTMADDVKTALQGNAGNRHCTHTASPEFIGQGNARHNGYPDTSLN